MEDFDRIQFDPNIMGGKPTIRGMRITVGAVVGLVASGHTVEKSLNCIHILKELISSRLLNMLHGVLTKWSIH